MFNKMVVQEALNRSLSLNDIKGWTPDKTSDDQDSLISMLIHDIFGGEILKTSNKKGWHFYNRIDGSRVDFTNSEMEKSTENIRFEDIPTTPEETCNYFEQEQYSTFLMKFVRAFEEAVGLEKSPSVMTL